MDSLPAEYRDKLETIKHTATEYRGFSDSFLLSVALRNTDEHLTPAIGLYCSLVAACAGMNVSLASKRPLRGGVDVGLDLERRAIYFPSSNDEDGQKILDYLGPGVSALAAPGFANDVVKPAYDFVLEQHQLWESNAKLAERYARVRRYFEKRLSLWRLGGS